MEHGLTLIRNFQKILENRTSVLYNVCISYISVMKGQQQSGHLLCDGTPGRKLEKVISLSFPRQSKQTFGREV